MDILLNMNPSLYWQIPLGLLLLVLSIFFTWLAFRIGKNLKIRRGPARWKRFQSSQGD